MSALFFVNEGRVLRKLGYTIGEKKVNCKSIRILEKKVSLGGEQSRESANAGLKIPAFP